MTDILNKSKTNVRDKTN